MKTIVLAAFATCLTLSAFAQDTTKRENADTIRIGGMIIIKDGDKNDTTRKSKVSFGNNRHRNKNANVQTNWWVVDLGFANYHDETAYGAAQSSGFVSTDINKDALKLRTGKSVNVNVWLFMQKLNIAKHVLHFKYGLGVELNNYRFDNERVQFQEDPTKVVLNPDWKGFDKNKLAADYATVPMMLNLNFTPKRERGFGISAGVSAGYLYSARQKTKESGNKEKVHDDFDLRKWKLSYIGELNLGPVKLYGAYAVKSMFEEGLDQTPYNVGIRLGRF